MKIQYASDLHLEFAENSSYIKHNPLLVTGDVLVLAGDIGYLGLKIRPNVHSYYNGIVHIGSDMDLIVSTLWGHISPQDAYFTERVISDFHRILFNGELLTFAKFNDECEKCSGFIRKAVNESEAKHKIVVTHHVPSFRMQNPKFTDNKANGAFIVELEDYIKGSGIEYWIYGHSHYNKDVQIESTLCVSNQLGYVFHDENLTFNPGKFIEVQ